MGVVKEKLSRYQITKTSDNGGFCFLTIVFVRLINQKKSDINFSLSQILKSVDLRGFAPLLYWVINRTTDHTQFLWTTPKS